MYYKLNKNSFIRKISNYSYLYSQLTKHDLFFDEVGRIFLNAIRRTPRSTEEMLEEIAECFTDATKEEIRSDFEEVLDKLTVSRYLSRGSTPEECEENEDVFSYDDVEAKTRTNTFLQDWSTSDVTQESASFISEIHRKDPSIHSCQIEINNLCNERCIHCYIPHKWKTRRLSKEQLFDVMEQLHEMGTLSLTLSGGEPLLHPDFIALLYHARKLDFSINVLTNLTMLTEDIVRALQDCNVSMVQTSLYSMVPEEHDHITKLAGSHAKTLAAIERLIQAKVPVQISCPCMRTNYRTYKEVLKWAAEHHCKAQTDFIMMARSDFSTDNLDERLTLDETRTLIEDMLEEDRDYVDFLKTYKPSNPDELKEQFKCGVGVNSICLGSNGEYYPCSGWQGMPVGTIEQRLKDVWLNSPQLKMLRNIRKGSFPKCMNCVDRDFCAGCMVRNFNESGGDMFCVSKHFCQVANLNRRIFEEQKAKLGIN